MVKFLRYDRHSVTLPKKSFKCLKTEAGVIVGTTLQQYSTYVVCVVFVEKFPAMLTPPVYIQNRQRR